jgi:hypothetical protein
MLKATLIFWKSWDDSVEVTTDIVNTGTWPNNLASKEGS